MYRLSVLGLLLILGISAGILYDHLVAVPEANREMVEKLKEDFPGEDLPDPLARKEKPAGKKGSLSPLVDLVSLQEQYPDIQGWLMIPETGIDYPVLQSSAEEPEYYIHRNYQGEPDVNGSLFLQWDCDVREGENLVVYGHNMNSGVMFGNLDRYAEKEYCQAHPLVYFQTLDGVAVYRVTAVLKTDVSVFPFQQAFFPEPDGLAEYVRQAKRLELFDNGETFDIDEADQVLTLVTCSYEWSGARNLVIAVRE